MNPEQHLSWLANAWAQLDPASPPGSFAHTFWALIGLLAIATFNGRFYVQWIYSERHGRSVMPISFWYMSAIGGMLYLAFNAHTGSPNGTLNYSLNIVIYARNLTHIWRERGVLTKPLRRAVNIFVVVVALVGIGVVAYTWYHEYHEIHQEQSGNVARAWIWIAIGTIGTGLFGCRFILQWLVSEAKRKSVVPNAFWYISVVAAVLQAASFLQRAEWINFFGVSANLPIYLRNIWLIRNGKAQPTNE